MTSQILKLVDFTKTQKSRYVKNELKKSLIAHQGLLYGQKKLCNRGNFVSFKPFSSSISLPLFLYIYIYTLIFNHISCAQVHELPWGHWQIGNNQDGKLYIYIYIYIYHIYYIDMNNIFIYYICLNINMHIIYIINIYIK